MDARLLNETLKKSTKNEKDVRVVKFRTITRALEYPKQDDLYDQSYQKKKKTCVPRLQDNSAVKKAIIKITAGYYRNGEAIKIQPYFF